MSVKHVSFWMILLAVLFQGCIEPTNPYQGLAPGEWRGVLYLENQGFVKPAQDLVKDGKPTYAIKEEGELPFNFEVRYKSADQMQIVIKNADERIIVDEVYWGRDQSVAMDTVLIDFPEYESHIQGKVSEGVLQGHWVVRSKTNYRIPFVAFHAEDYRFPDNVNEDAEINVDGKWAVQFGSGKDAYPAIAEFEQNGDRLAGTFLTNTGDYRYLEGLVEGQKLYLSTFDGAHAFLFHAKKMAGDTLEGFFKSGKHYRTTWTAWRDPSFELNDPDSMTYLTENSGYFEISLNNSEGKLVTIDRNTDVGKPKIIQILGTWCPNCKDETEFLVDFLERNNDLNLDVYGIAFERYKEPEEAYEVIETYKQKLSVPYDILYGGYYNKSNSSEVLSMLNRVISYPTLILLDQNNRVRHIHTGFAGPATSKYDDFKSKFNQKIKSLLEE